MISVYILRFLGLCALLISTSLLATPVLTVEMPAGSSLTANATIDFGGMQFRYVDPASKIQAPDNTFTVTFTDIPLSAYSTYHIERASQPDGPFSQLFAPDLAPDSAGFLQYHDPQPGEAWFYRLLIITDTQRTFTIRNTGTTDLINIEVSLVGADSSFFELNTGTMSTTLTPSASTTFTVIYFAEDPDIRTAELSITGNVPGPIVLTLRGGDLPFPAPLPSLANVTLTPASELAPAAIAGTVLNGPVNGSVFLEASSDLGQLDDWETIATISLDANGSATFGVPTPVADPGSVGAPQNFYRLRAN
jgi:hypothetical protein